MKNYSGAICYNEKPFNALLSMFKNLNTSDIEYNNISFRLPMKDIIQNGKPIGMKYDEISDRIIEAKIRIPMDEKTSIDYVVGVEGKRLCVYSEKIVNKR